ncbi:MAG: hypothetical protein QM768_02385 [Agriterribacter sp.]
MHIAKNKATETDKSVIAFITKSADTGQKRKDSFELLELMESVSMEKGFQPSKCWKPCS